MLVVGGTNWSDEWWDEGGSGAIANELITVSAPADEILTTDLDGLDYITSQGTSLATPLVAPVAGLVISQARESEIDLAPIEIRDLLSESADDCNYATASGHDNHLGYGRVNAFKALLRTPGWKELEADLTIEPHYYDNDGEGNDISPYVIVDQLVVPDGKTLTILPGTRLKFAPDASLEVYGGTLIAEGEEGELIKFVADEEDPWFGIYVEGGTAHLSFCDISGALLPFFSLNAVGDPAVRIEDSQIHGGVNGIRIWGSPGETHELTRVDVIDVPNLTNYGGLYFSNTYIQAHKLTVSNSGYRTGYFYNTSGKYSECIFEGATANYGLAFSNSSANGRFECCVFDHIAPSAYPAAPIWCIASAAPQFGYSNGETVWNNTISDDSDYLIRFAGTGAKPVILNFENRLEQNLTGQNKFIRWDPPRSGTYSAKRNYWFTTPQLSQFDPDTASYWEFGDYLIDDPTLCAGGGGLDDVAVLDSGAYYEEQQEWNAAQAYYLALAEADTLDFATRFMAGARAVAVDRRIDELAQAEVDGLAELLNTAASSQFDSIAIERLRLGHLTDEAHYTTAIAGHTSLLSRGLSPEDSLLTLIDIYHTQLLSGEASSLDEATREFAIAQVNHAMDALIALHSPESAAETPSNYTLHSVYPNPFNASTTIRFEIPVAGMVKLKVYDITGRLVATPVSEIMNPGAHAIQFDASQLSSGVYFCRMETGEFLQTVKMVVLR